MKCCANINFYPAKCFLSVCVNAPVWCGMKELVVNLSLKSYASYTPRKGVSRSALDEAIATIKHGEKNDHLLDANF